MLGGVAMTDDARLTLVEHLGELRKRVIISCIAIIIGALACYNYIDDIIQIVVKPAAGLDFIYLSPPELFLAYVKISLVLGLVVALPILLFQIWMFIKPGLKQKEKKYVLFAMFMGIIFFVMGITFAYYIIIPMTIQFFIKMSIDQIAPLFSFANYISFISSLLLSFGLVFELPLIVILLTQLGLVAPNTFKKYRKLVILGIFIVAAVLTPPDIVSQTMMAVPMLLLYEFSIIISTIIYGKKKKQKEDPSEIDDES
jgi:sec-independent protein translocase protein TatC